MPRDEHTPGTDVGEYLANEKVQSYRRQAWYHVNQLNALAHHAHSEGIIINIKHGTTRTSVPKLEAEVIDTKTE